MSGYISLILIAIIFILILIDFFYSKKIDKDKLNKTIDNNKNNQKEDKNNGTHSE